MSIPVINYKFTMQGIGQYFKDSGVTFQDSDKAKLQEIFNLCDTEDAQGRKYKEGDVRDQELNANERMTFLEKIKNTTFYKNLVELAIIMDIIEDNEASKEIQGKS